MTLLTADQIQAELTAVGGWELDGSQITRTVTRKDFGDALRYVNAVGYLAEQAFHHPDITVSWNKVTLTLSTHSEGGLTVNDFNLAKGINALG
jgi:4a-hydroxytetrahydrobiopterin dehydratase